ncbi:MAG: FecR family protein [Chloroflexi bacterium]|nr:FecR family protein [Chloroflexota bacterium]
MFKKYLAVLLLISFIFLAGFGSQAWAVSEAWKLVARINGKVESQKSNEAGWSPIWQARLLRDGDRARTLGDSRARIILADKSYVILGQNTTVELENFKLTPQSRFVNLKLLTGRLRAEVSKFMGKDSNFEITTPNGVLSARGTEFFVEQKPENEEPVAGEEETAQLGGLGNTVLMVFSGAVWVAGSTPVYAGQSAIIQPGGFTMIYQTGALPPGAVLGGGTEGEGTEGTGGTEGGGDPDVDLTQSTGTGDQQFGPANQGGQSFGDGGTGGQGNQGEIIPTPPSYGIIPILISPGTGHLFFGIAPGGGGQLPVNVNPGTGNFNVIIR